MRILIVDDDEMVQQVCEGMLHALNHLSMVVGDATAAIQCLTESSEPFDCIILDNGVSEDYFSGSFATSICRSFN